MTKKIFFITFICIFKLPILVLAQPAVNQSAKTRNPFKAQIPRKVKIEKIIPPPTPVTKLEPVKEKERPTPIIQPTIIENPKPIMPRVVEEVIPPKPFPKLKISGIIWNSQRPQAIINGEILEIGDTISDAQLIDIQPYQVQFLFEKEKHTLKP